MIFAPSRRLRGRDPGRSGRQTGYLGQGFDIEGSGERGVYEIGDNHVLGREPGHHVEVAQRGHNEAGDKVPEESAAEYIHLNIASAITIFLIFQTGLAGEGKSDDLINVAPRNKKKVACRMRGERDASGRRRLTKNLHREIFQPSAGLFSSPWSVVNMAVDISVPGHIMLDGRTSHCRVRPAKVYPRIWVERVRRIWYMMVVSCL